MTTGSAEPDVAAIRQMIRRVGLRATGSRVKTYTVVRGAGRPVSHTEAAQELEAQGIDRATVYRNLNDLARAGLLRRQHIGRSFSFESVGAHESDHVHFVCTECGDVLCLPEVHVQVSAARGAPRSVRANSCNVELSGRCDGCSA